MPDTERITPRTLLGLFATLKPLDDEFWTVLELAADPVNLDPGPAS